MKALINQLKNMTDDKLKTIYKSMADKCVGLLIQQKMDASLDLSSKVEELKEKYFYVETEINNREIDFDLVITGLKVN